MSVLDGLRTYYSHLGSPLLPRSSGNKFLVISWGHLKIQDGYQPNTLFIYLSLSKELNFNCWENSDGHTLLARKNSYSQFCSAGDSVVKNPPANAGDPWGMSSIPGSGRFPGGRSGNPLQYSCLENPLDRGAWRATVHGVAKESETTEWLSTHAHTRF